MKTPDHDDQASDDRSDRAHHGLPDAPRHADPGGPYFGRLLIVLLLAVAFCGVMTWYLSSTLVR